MAKVKQSFISNIIGKQTYDEFKVYAQIIIPIGTCVLAIIFCLSFFFHWGFISTLLNLITGTSLLFVAYIAALVLYMDIEVDVDDAERYYGAKHEKEIKSNSYKLTVVWSVVLILFGIAAIYLSNKYRKHYAFECETFLVDKQAQIYHLNWDNDCEVAAETGELEKMKGYQIDKSYTLCVWCEERADDAFVQYSSNRYFRR